MLRNLLIETLLWVPVLVFNGWVAIKIDHWNQKRREMKFLKYVKIKYPDATIIFSAIATSDNEAMRQIREQLKES